MSFIIPQHFSECIMWYSSKTTNHILRITPFSVGSSPLETYCNLKNVHLKIQRQSNIVWTYGILYACSTLLKEYSRFWRMFCWICETSPYIIWVRYLIKQTQLLLDSIANISFSESCLNEGWSDQEEEYTCQTKVVEFFKNAASSQEVLFAIQDNMLLFCVKKRTSIL